MSRTKRFSAAIGQTDRIRLLETLGRYSRFVNVSKTLLVLMTLLLIGTVVVMPLMRGDSGGLRIAFTATEETPQQEPVMKNPRFQGTDHKDQPYLVTAESAIQRDKNTIDLNKVSADMTLKDEAWLLVTARKGTLALGDKELWLEGNVTLFHDQGYEMKTSRVLVDLAKSEARGDTPLNGQAAMGHIEAGSFTVFDRGRHLVFHGPVKLVIQPGAKK